MTTAPSSLPFWLVLVLLVGWAAFCGWLLTKVGKDERAEREVERVIG